MTKLLLIITMLFTILTLPSCEGIDGPDPPPVFTGIAGMNTYDSRFTLVPGGLPLIADGDVVGAIGVGGGSKEQDLEIARFVADKFREITAKQQPQQSDILKMAGFPAIFHTGRISG